MWTVSHVIDKNSPLYGHTAESLASNMTMLTVMFKAIDPALSKTVYKTHAYSYRAIVFEGTFEPVVDRSALPRRISLDFTKFNRVAVDKNIVQPVDIPWPCSAVARHQDHQPVGPQ
jgi:inward rectifier potassium channel